MPTQNPPHTLQIPAAFPKLQQLKLTEQNLVQAILESWIDGVLVITPQGKLVQSNGAARRICDRLSSCHAHPAPIPAEIWQICQTLMQSDAAVLEQPIVIDSEITLNKTNIIRVRVRWLETGAGEPSPLLVILEDRCQSIGHLVSAETDRYGLTPREAEVWFLYRAQYTYKAIATELHITENTVKKHLKSIRVKQKTVSDDEEYYSEFG